MRSNIFIDTLIFGREHLEAKQDFILESLKNHLQQNNYLESYINFVVPEILKDNFSTIEGVNYRLNTEGYFRLLNYESLEVANNGLDLSNKSLGEAKKSLRVAIVAILFSTVPFIWSFITTPETKISQDKTNELKVVDSNVNLSILKLIAQDSFYHINSKGTDSVIVIPKKKNR